ncbi:MAG: transposase [Gammaproteobacteria bacterium]|nr:transposase [Gammaproteobacteria bacterium]
MDYLDVLSNVCERFNWVIHAYCLMTNHYHLLIETPDGNLSRGMRQLNGVYTQRFNRNNNRVGHVFQGRYKAINVQKESYLLELARYIVLNPVRAQMVRSARDWRWSSYRAAAGFIKPEKWLMVSWILSSFSRKKSEAVKLYRAFVSEGRDQPGPWEALKNQIYLGDEEFVNEVQDRISEETNLSEIPSSQKRQAAKLLDYYEKKYSDRDTSIFKAYESGAYSMKAIGDYFGLHYSWVSRIIKAMDKT